MKIFLLGTNRYYIRLVLSLIVIIFLQSSVYASQREVVKWSELGDHLVRKSILIESMPVVDCPDGIDTESAEHLVCQVIENTFYKWKEYEFFNAAGDPRMAIEMIKPKACFLTAEEAQILLNGSKLCERQALLSPIVMTTRQPSLTPRRVKRPVYKRSALSDIELPLERSVDRNLSDKRSDPEIRATELLPLLRESIQGSDDRVRVADYENIAGYPWNTICYLDFLVAGYSYRGSGTLIASNCVLTCGHNVWDQELEVWSTSMAVTPAQSQEYQGGTIYAPFGTVADTTLSSNNVYIDDSGGFEFDYGVVKLRQSFPGISTYMPIEYDSTPSVINVAGYPGAVQDENNSYDMWYDYGDVVGYDGILDRVLLHRADTSGGQSGAPVWRYDDFTEIYRIVAIHVFGADLRNGACRLVSAIEPIISEWMAYDPVVPFVYTHFSYIPYFSTSSSRWTGLALANYNNGINSVKIDYYATDGSPLGSEQKSIKAYGQEAFVMATASGTEGWVKISSTAPLQGLALIGDAYPATMFEINLEVSLRKKLLFPHLAAYQDWRSFAMICNPNDNNASISYKFYNSDGAPVYQKSSTIPANGSVRHDLYTLFQNDLSGGTMVVESNQPITAFLLYDNLSTTWKAGLSAVTVE